MDSCLPTFPVAPSSPKKEPPMKRAFLLTAVLALVALALTACGDKDETSSTSTTSPRAATKEVPPADDISQATASGATAAKADTNTGVLATKDPGSDTTPVYQCDSFAADGTIGNLHIGGFDDVTVRGVSCGDMKRIVTAEFKPGTTPTLKNISGYSCSTLYREGNRITGRCVSGTKAFRATTVPVEKTPTARPSTAVVTSSNVVSKCPSTSLFYDFTVRGMSSSTGTQAVALYADKFRTTSNVTLNINGTDLPCGQLYAEGNHKTIRCVDSSGRNAVRFTVGTTPVTAASGVSTDIVTGCPAYSQYFAITVRGVTCQYAVSVMNDGGDIFVAMKRGQSTTPPRSGFTCTRIDTGGQERTIRCAKGSTAFRFSMVGDG